MEANLYINFYQNFYQTNAPCRTKIFLYIRTNLFQIISIPYTRNLLNNQTLNRCITYSLTIPLYTTHYCKTSFLFNKTLKPSFNEKRILKTSFNSKFFKITLIPFEMEIILDWIRSPIRVSKLKKRVEMDGKTAEFQ